MGVAALVPILCLVLSGAVMGILESREPARRGQVLGLAWMGTSAAILAGLRLWGHRASTPAWVESDPLTQFTSLIVLFGLALSLPLANSAAHRVRGGTPDRLSVLILTAAAALLILSTRHLAIVFLGFEAVSLGAFSLTPPLSAKDYLRSGAARASLAILGGTALLYATAGTARLEDIEGTLGLASGSPSIVAMAVAMVILGVYSVAAMVVLRVSSVSSPAGLGTILFFSVALPVSSMSVLLQIAGWLPSLHAESSLLWWIAALGMTWGNVAALVQDDPRRLLAYASLAQLGYLSIGVVAASDAGRAAVLFGLLAFLSMAVGLVAAATALGIPGHFSLRRWRGFGWRTRWRGLATSAVLLSLAGIAPTAGFLGKFYLLSAAIERGLIPLALIALANWLVGAYVFLHLGARLYLGDPPPESDLPALSLGLRILLLLGACSAVLLGVVPELPLAMAKRAAMGFF